jgi:probable F420-dependent oxidoreductase
MLMATAALSSGDSADRDAAVGGGHGVKFGIVYNTAYQGMDPTRLVALATHAEDCGFESFYVPEHIALYPGARLGAFELPSSLAVADPLECLSFVAAATTRILLGTAVLLIPYHHPVALAKRLSTIDQLSGGRMSLLTVGVGALPGEAAAVGVDYRTRGRRADEAIDVLRLLWAGDEQGVSFEGEFFRLSKVCSFPKPYESRPLPIHIGGSSLAAARRAGLRGDGYFPGGRLTAAQRAEQLAVARALAADRGRDSKSFEYTRWGSFDLTEAQVQALGDESVTRIVVSPSATGVDEQRREIAEFAARHWLR